jgi:radical SAM superfamily enzyme YgiQ (UPF0313 family)
VEEAASTFGAHLFDFLDPTMTLNRKWFCTFCEILAARPISKEIAWGFETRVDQVDEDLLRRAQAAGCESVLFGIESGSQTILDAMNKNATVTGAWEALAAGSKAGLRLRATLIIGYPYETIETLRETRDFADQAMSRFGVEFLPSFLGVYPATRVHDQVDRGEGGSRWVPGVRGEWGRARRDRPMIEIGRLDEVTLSSFMQTLRAKVRQT